MQELCQTCAAELYQSHRPRILSEVTIAKYRSQLLVPRISASFAELPEVFRCPTARVLRNLYTRPASSDSFLHLNCHISCDLSQYVRFNLCMGTILLNLFRPSIDESMSQRTHVVTLNGRLWICFQGLTLPYEDEAALYSYKVFYLPQQTCSFLVVQYGCAPRL